MRTKIQELLLLYLVWIGERINIFSDLKFYVKVLYSRS